MKILKTLAAAALAIPLSLGAAATAHAGTAGDLGDGNGDGIADVWTTKETGRYTRDASDSHTWFYKGIYALWSTGVNLGISEVTHTDMGLGLADQVSALPDMTGDQKADALARFGDHLYLFKNDGTGKLVRSTEIGHGWGNFDQVIYAGRLNGDSTQYLLGRNKVDHNLYAYKFTSGGAVTGMGVAGTNWGSIRFLLAPGQITGDAKHDLMAIGNDGNLNCYRSLGLGKLADAGVCGRGWNGFQTAFIAGDMDKNGSWELVGVKKTAHPSTNCDRFGNCDPVEPLCTTTPPTAYATEYEKPASTDWCVKQGYTYRLKPEFRTPMYVYRNMGNAQWGSAMRIGYDMFMYATFA